MTAAGCLLEAEQRLSQSILWRINRRWFEEAGVAAWQERVVPSYVTTNAYLARSYAQVVFRYLLDVRGALDPRQLVHIVELGSATGRFGYYFLGELERLRAAFPDLPRYRLVLSDCTSASLEYMRRHPYLAPYVRAGTLDFARFDAETDEALELLDSGDRLDASTLVNPLVVLANYVFDGLPQDAFRVQDGQLSELLVTLASTQAEEPDPTAPGLLGRLRASFTARAFAPTGDDAVDEILELYRAALPDHPVLLPVGAFRCLRNLHELAGGTMMLLAGDKGWSQLPDISDDSAVDPEITLHGSVSMHVNFHALCHYAEHLGGQAVASAGAHGHLAVAAVLFGKGPYPETRLAFEEAFVHMSPLDVYELRLLAGEATPRSLAFVLSVLRLSAWDPELLCRFAPALEALAPRASAGDARLLFEGLRQVVDRIYPIGDGRDVSFVIGKLLYAIGQVEVARRCFEQSVAHHPRAAESHVNLGICHHLLGDVDGASRAFEAALAVDPGNASARAWRTRSAKP